MSHIDHRVQELMDRMIDSGRSDDPLSSAEWNDNEQKMNALAAELSANLLPPDARDRIAKWLWTRRPANPSKFGDCLVDADDLLAALLTPDTDRTEGEG